MAKAESYRDLNAAKSALHENKELICCLHRHFQPLQNAENLKLMPHMLRIHLHQPLSLLEIEQIERPVDAKQIH